MAAYSSIIQGKLNPRALRTTQNVVQLSGKLPNHIERKIHIQTSRSLNNARKYRTVHHGTRLTMALSLGSGYGFRNQQNARSYNMNLPYCYGKPKSFLDDASSPRRSLSLGKKFVQVESTEEGLKISKLRSTASQVLSVLNQTNDDIMRKVVETKEKLPPLPKLKLPSLPRFVVAQKLSKKKSVECASEVQLERKIVTMDHNFEKEQHDLEKAVLDANDEVVVYNVSSEQTSEHVQEHLAKFKDKITEQNTKKTNSNMDVYRRLATFATHLPSVAKLKEIDLKKLIKSRTNKEPESPVIREEYDLETAILNTYLSARMTSLPDETLETLDAIRKVTAVKPEPKLVKKESSKVLELLSKAVPSSGKSKVKQEKAKTKIVISQSSIDSKTKALVYSIRNAKSSVSKLRRIEDFCKHIITYPEARHLAMKMAVLPPLLREIRSDDETMQAEVRKALALVGYAEPVKGRGIRILTIDGGGARGIVAIESLRELEERCNKPIHEMFDFICAVSSGAVLAYLIAFAKAPLVQCESLFQTLTKDVFQRSTIVGTGNLVWSHSFYNTDTWIKVLRSAHAKSDDLLIETAADPSNPKVAALSTLVNQTAVKPHLFRNYNVPSTVQSQYPGTCQYLLWEALRASTAAPGYFEECNLGDSVHQDGGLLCNNPTAMALHECKLLWPSTPIQCIVSLGTGRYVPEANPNIKSSSLKARISQLVMSATDTEAVHTMISDLLPSGSYYRFNPYMSEDIQLDEHRIAKIDLLQNDARTYLRRNSRKMDAAADKLMQTKNTYHQWSDWLKMKKQIYYK